MPPRRNESTAQVEVMLNGVGSSGRTQVNGPRATRDRSRYRPTPASSGPRPGPVLEANWREGPGYTVPSTTVYPFQWLWDSCFHAVTWAVLGEGERARRELAHLFRTQSPLGFVPHVDYEHEPGHHAEFWRREGQSSITQPPMFGHAVAVLHRLGVPVDDLVEPATRGLQFLLRRPRTHRRTGRPVPPVGERRRRQPTLGPLVPRRLGPRALVRREG